MATELFSNNARGVIAGEVYRGDSSIILNSGVETFANPPWDAIGEHFQRATIYHPDDPGHNEIVFITDVDKSSNTLYVKRIQEGTGSNGRPYDWPTGSIIEARVTAGMLKSLSQGKPYIEEVPAIPADLPHKWPLFAPMVMGRSVNVPLGPIGAIAQWVEGWLDIGEIVTSEDVESTYFVALDSGSYVFPLTYYQHYQYTNLVLVADEDQVDRHFYAQRTDEPITIQLNDDGIGMVVTEVGFVSIQNGGGGPAQISVSVGGVQLVQSTPIDEPAGSVVRFFNQSQRLAPTDSIQVDVLTRSTGEMKGYFYWVGFSVGSM